MNKNATTWIEAECGITDYRVRTFRGRVPQKEIDDLTSGREIEFLRMTDCYWYNDADDESETGKTIGTYDRLGHAAYSNFTGEIYLRCSTILNVAILKAGFDSEPVKP